jgi:hypothetical protein
MLILSAAVRPTAQEPKPKGAAAQDAQALKDDKAKTSYAVGMNLGGAIQKDADLDVNLIVQGLKKAFGGGKTLLTAAEMREILNRLAAERQLVILPASPTASVALAHACLRTRPSFSRWS